MKQLTASEIKDNFTPHELFTILNNYLDDNEFIKPTNDYIAELQKESLQELKIALDVLNSHSIDFYDKYTTNVLSGCFNNYTMNEALEQYINDCTVYDDLAMKIDSLINPTIELKGTFKTQDDAIKVTEFLKDLGYATNDDYEVITD